MTPAEQAAADKAAADKKTADLIAADQKAKADAQNKVEVVITGDAVLGGPFNIYGSGFGASKGTLSVGGREILTGRWDDNVIGGSLPPGIKGAVVLTTSHGVMHGVFPHVPKVVIETTTVTVKTA